MEKAEQSVYLHSPLIVAPTSSEGASEIGDDFREVVIDEMKKQLWLAGPLMAVGLLQYGLQMISVMFVGHLGELSLAGASMGTSFASVTGFNLLQAVKERSQQNDESNSSERGSLSDWIGFNVADDFPGKLFSFKPQFTKQSHRLHTILYFVARLLGMASALDTFCGQSYGARQYHMLGIHTQRAMFVLSLVSVPLAVIGANTRSILVALGQDEEIAMEAGTYARFLIPSIFAYGLLQCLVKFLQAQNIVFPMMVSSGIIALLHLPVCWILVFKVGLGMRGAALANCFSYWINVLLLAIYVKFSSLCTKTWTGFSKECLRDIPIFLRLAVPSAVMVCLEMWSFEMMVLLSGLLPNAKLETSVLSICLNTASTIWMIPGGLSNAVSTRVSNELGAGRYKRAQMAIYVVIGMAISEGILVGSVLIGIRNIWGYAYSNEIQVIRYVAAMQPIIAASNLLDGIQGVLSGTARGCGWQKIGAYINLGSYYLVGLPSAILLAFVLHIGGKGLWLGVICALTVQVVSLLVITMRTKWEKEAQDASRRVHEAAIPMIS